jgi:hypothetical protein
MVVFGWFYRYFKKHFSYKDYGLLKVAQEEGEDQDDGHNNQTTFA